MAQDVVFRLDKAYQAFFSGLMRFPKFKRNGRYNSFTYPQESGFKIVDGKLRLSMIGLVRIRLHRDLRGPVKTCTIVRDIDQWYACITAEYKDKVTPTNKKPSIGVDVGVSAIVALSDGTIVSAPKTLKNFGLTIKAAQKSLSNKKKGSKNWEKAKVRLEKAWRKVRNQRNDFTHKTSHFLAGNYSTVVFEDLAIPNMVKNHSLATAILGASWGKLRRLTAYKTERRGGRVILVGPRGTSQKCSGCGKTAEKDLSVRTHSCPDCGLKLDRDVNGARNILARGLEQARVETKPLPVIRIGKFSRGSKKPTPFAGG